MRPAVLHTTLGSAWLYTFAMILLTGCAEHKEQPSSPHGKGNQAQSGMAATVVPPGEASERVTRSEPAAPAPVDPEAIVIGLDADLSSATADAGQAIRRGAELAIHEINENGGLLGRRVQLVPKDHRGNPARGVDNIEELAALPNLVAVVGGLHSTVIVAELEGIHRHGIPLLVPWAAATEVIKHGHEPSYVFRVSLTDTLVAEAMAKHAAATECKRPGLLLERSLWGQSNEKTLMSALDAQDSKPVGVRWFHIGSTTLEAELEDLLDFGAECIMLVANPPEGTAAVTGMARLPAGKRLPIISHLGITGGGRKFFRNLEDSLASVDLVFVQTFSFFNPRFPDRAARVLEGYCKQLAGCEAPTPTTVFSPAGTVHAYELVHLLGAAIRKAGTTERSAVRSALEQLGVHEGLIRNYNPPFTPTRHDALTAEELQMCRFVDGAIKPIALQASDVNNR